MKRNSLITGALLLLFALTGMAQDFIGMPAEEIKKQMRAGEKEFALDETTVNKVYKYLKYVDEMEMRTILFFLSDDDICTYYRIIYDNELYASVVKQLDSTGLKVADTLWVQEINGKRYRKELKKHDWFFTVTTRPATEEALEKKEK